MSFEPPQREREEADRRPPAPLARRPAAPPPTVQRILHLQRTVGNRAARRALANAVQRLPGLARQPLLQRQDTPPPTPGQRLTTEQARDLFTQGNAAYDRGEFAQALAIWTRLLNEFDFDPAGRTAMLFNVAQAHFRLGQYAEAASFYEQYLAAGGRDSAAIARERLAEARRHTGISTAEARRLFERASAAYERGDFQRAIILWTQLLEEYRFEDADRPSILFNLGQANFRLRRFATAIPYYEQYLASGATTSADIARERLTEARREIGVGLDSAGAVVQIESAEARQLFERGSRAYERGDFRQAIIIWTRLLEEFEFAPAERLPMLFNLGQANFRLERYATAIPFYEQYLAGGGGDSADTARERLALARQRAGVTTPLADQP